MIAIKERHQRVMGESLVQLGIEKYRQGTAEVIRPIYGRKSEAEIKFNVTVT